jgi:clan AA aspartic protease (TIGR02281 family)
LKAIANSQFVLFSFLGGEHVHMSDYKIGKAVFIAAAVTLANPSLAQSPATGNQAAMTFAVEKKAVRLSAMANGIPLRFLVDTGATKVAFPRIAAGKLGLNLKSSSATSTASTADGTKYPITLFRLRRLEIGSCVLRNIEAMIVAGPMAEPLLGMSALLRMNVEMRDGKMSLRCPVDSTWPTAAP